MVLRLRTVRTRVGMWRLKSPLPESRILESHLAWLLRATTPRISAWKSLARRFRIDAFCGLFLDDMNRGLELTPRILGRLAERGIRLGLDIYGR